MARPPGERRTGRGRSQGRSSKGGAPSSGREADQIRTREAGGGSGMSRLSSEGLGEPGSRGQRCAHGSRDVPDILLARGPAQGIPRRRGREPPDLPPQGGCGRGEGRRRRGLLPSVLVGEDRSVSQIPGFRRSAMPCRKVAPFLALALLGLMLVAGPCLAGPDPVGRLVAVQGEVRHRPAGGEALGRGGGRGRALCRRCPAHRARRQGRRAVRRRIPDQAQRQHRARAQGRRRLAPAGRRGAGAGLGAAPRAGPASTRCPRARCG